MFKKTDEKLGIIFALIDIFIFGLIPILLKYSVGLVHPLFFGGVLALVTSLITIPILVKKRKIKKIFERKNLVYLFIVAFFGSVFTSLLFLYGASMTSGINSSLLLQSEPIFSIILTYYILKEHISKKQIFATFLIIIGVGIIVYNGTLALNIGDILILFTPLGYQIAHLIVKKYLKHIDTFVLVMGRFFYSGIFMMMLSTLLSTNQFEVLYQPLIITLVLSVAALRFVGYSLWLESIKILNLSKATSLLAPYPIVSVFFAWYILSELPSIYQITGLAIVIVGMYLTGKVKSKSRK